MGRDYGIGICKNTLRLLSSEKEIKDRLAKAFSEVKVMQYEKGENGDLAKQLLKKRDKLHDKYISLKKKDKDDVKVLRNLADDLVFLCVEIIQSNTRKLTKKESD